MAIIGVQYVFGSTAEGHMKAVLITITFVVAAAFLAPTFYAPPVHAASQNECAIWICLPGGFPSGCEGPERAFKKRLKKGKSPLPSWNSCSVNDPNTPAVDAQASFGAEPYVPCRDTYHLVITRPDRDAGTPRRAECVSDETRSSPFGGEVPIDSYTAEPRPNGGRFVTYTINGQLVHPVDEEGNDLVDARFFY